MKADGIYTECMFTKVGNAIHFWTGLVRNENGGIWTGLVRSIEWGF